MYGFFLFMYKYGKIICFRSEKGFAKPRARPLHAEAPCNYIHGRFAAALQSVFENPFPPSRILFFHNLFIKETLFFICVVNTCDFWYNLTLQ